MSDESVSADECPANVPEEAPPLRVMVSSTVVDLPLHRPMIRDACVRAGMLPLMMEYLPARDEDAVTDSRRMVDASDIYVGVFGFRYGHIASGWCRSLTHMEYERAVERGIPCLVFLMADDHPLTQADVDGGTARRRLERLREKLARTHRVRFFSSPGALQTDVFQALVEVHRRMVEGTTSSTNIETTASVSEPVHVMETEGPGPVFTRGRAGMIGVLVALGVVGLAAGVGEVMAGLERGPAGEDDAVLVEAAPDVIEQNEDHVASEERPGSEVAAREELAATPSSRRDHAGPTRGGTMARRRVSTPQPTSEPEVPSTPKWTVCDVDALEAARVVTLCEKTPPESGTLVSEVRKKAKLPLCRIQEPIASPLRCVLSRSRGVDIERGDVFVERVP